MTTILTVAQDIIFFYGAVSSICTVIIEIHFLPERVKNIAALVGMDFRAIVKKIRGA